MVSDDAGVAAELVLYALRNPGEQEGLEVVRALERLPRGLFRTAALRTLRVEHSSPLVRQAALRVLAGG
jgi:hypothetical protein